MATLSIFVRYEICFFLVALAGIIGYRMLTGKINLQGLLDTKDGSGQYSSARLQLLLSTLTGACYFIAAVAEDPTKFPPVPDYLLAALGGSNLVYLGSKSASWLLRAKAESINQTIQSGG
ncbi:MAG: hypothetical protein HY033_09600 [Ignavibacteriae bacterium]|nr:hypothetical protein [Ignavibacteriota bacterium]